MKKSTSLNSTSKRGLRRILLLCFFALLIPASILIYHTYKQLRLEAYYQYRALAEELTLRINKKLDHIISVEENRAFTDYSFLNVSGTNKSSLLQRSPLSTYPVNQNIPGLISYFQIDDNGTFSTPLLPPQINQSPQFGISEKELSKRQALHEKALKILIASKIAPENSPLKTHSIKPETATTSIFENKRQLSYDAFDKLEQSVSRPRSVDKKSQYSLGRVEDIAIEAPYSEALDSETAGLFSRKKRPKKAKKRARRSEKNILPEKKAADTTITAENYSINLFESKVDSFNIGMLDSGHFVIFRNVWKNDKRQIQGAIIKSENFINNIIKTEFMGTSLSTLSKLVVAFEGNIYAIFGQKYNSGYTSSAEFNGNLLFQSRLHSPLNDMELIYSINSLPTGAGSRVVIWTAGILLSALCVIFIFIYRLGIGQIRLAQQQQDFVSAVSHELKTPLTSIRMYGEILKEGWADDEKKKTYYNFIYDESERLSRLITNVLQLARMTRNDLPVNLKETPVNTLIDNMKSRITSQTQQTEFKLTLKCDDNLKNSTISIDEDYFIQIIINLVDNAIKFSAKSEIKQIDIHCRIYQENKLQISVRDYGPGIDKKQMKKIFTLFYRSENEITRETIGTGIGLALVHQLTNIMKGEIDVSNKQPGAEFRLLFPVL
ncbi:Sensory box histidine kinase [hydrothermal vent metagenome]|uniref:histidine kinase n=1 Tax=hydrothermal vent metagenome TaxID=652676 RepID=A0A3B0XM87_9ZZZZ